MRHECHANISDEMKWVDEFCREAEAKGLPCRVLNRVNGWPETVKAGGRLCYSKSVSYNFERGLYFIGVDPKRLAEAGERALLCGGAVGELQDIFVIAWTSFVETVRQGEALNTYKPPREYWQYKFKIKGEGRSWVMSVQGGRNPELDVTRWRYGIAEAIEHLKSH